MTAQPLNLSRVYVWPMAERNPRKTYVHLADPGWEILGQTICRLAVKESARDEAGTMCPVCADVAKQRQHE